jgi:transcriptional regulator with XRE-family HTH domain
LKDNELRAEFARKGFTQQQIAKLMGISLETLYNKMHNKNKRGGFTDKELGRLKEILDIDDLSKFI